MTFRNQVVLITGGSSGIGLATARAFAAESAHVWLVARDPLRLTQALAEVKAACKQSDQICGTFSADVSDPQQAADAVAAVTKQAGSPNIVVNSHGVTRPGYFQELDLAVFRQQMDINYFGALHVIRAVVPDMIERRSGVIVNVASGAALVPAFGYTAYSAAKHALCGLSEVLRLELKAYNIHVSVVYPPDTATPQLTWEAPYRPPETNAIYGGTVITPETVANSILRGIRHHHYSIIPGLEMNAAAKAASLLGDWRFVVLDTLIARARRQHEHHPRPR